MTSSLVQALVKLGFNDTVWRMYYTTTKIYLGDSEPLLGIRKILEFPTKLIAATTYLPQNKEGGTHYKMPSERGILKMAYKLPAHPDLKRLEIGTSDEGDIMTMRVFLLAGRPTRFFYFGRDATVSFVDRVKHWTRGVTKDQEVHLKLWRARFGEPTKPLKAHKAFTADQTKRIWIGFTNEDLEWQIWASWINWTGAFKRGIPQHILTFWRNAEDVTSETFIDNVDDILDKSTLIKEIGILDEWKPTVLNMLSHQWELHKPPEVPEAIRTKIMELAEHENLSNDRFIHDLDLEDSEPTEPSNARPNLSDEGLSDDEFMSGLDSEDGEPAGQSIAQTSLLDKVNFDTQTQPGAAGMPDTHSTQPIKEREPIDTHQEEEEQLDPAEQLIQNMIKLRDCVGDVCDILKSLADASRR